MMTVAAGPDRVPAGERLPVSSAGVGQPASDPVSRDHRAMMLFELEGVTARRAGRVVLNEVDAEIGEGVTAVVGPSGAGKSTLLRLLNRLAEPDGGNVRFAGTDVRDCDVLELRRRACLVAQLPALLEGTVADNLRFAARMAGGPALAEAEALQAAGLDPRFGERRAEQLSVGEQQRAMLARALVVGPRALLLDEPTAALDDQAREAVESTLRRLRHELGVSIVLVTHDRAQAQRLGDRTLRLDGGRIVSELPAVST